MLPMSVVGSGDYGPPIRMVLRKDRDSAATWKSRTVRSIQGETQRRRMTVCGQSPQSGLANKLGQAPSQSRYRIGCGPGE